VSEPIEQFDSINLDPKLFDSKKQESDDRDDDYTDFTQSTIRRRSSATPLKGI
jgi:hypothetical protein